MVRYWVVRMRLENSEGNLLDCEVGKNNNFVGIRWLGVGDLTGYTTKEKLKILKEKFYSACKPEKSGTLNNWVSHVNSFINRIKEENNDIVFLPIYPKQDPEGYFKKYLIGKIISEPYYVKEPQDACVDNRRKVEWLIEVPKKRLSARLNKSLESPHTVYNIDKHKREIQTLLEGKS